MDQHVDSRVMGCTRAEFARWLRDFCDDASLLADSDAATIPIGEAALRVSVRELAPHRIGLMSFPRLEVGFGYAGRHAADARAWITRFDRHTQRGGG